MPDDDLFGAIEAGGTKFNCAVERADGTVVAKARIATRDAVATLGEVRAFFTAHGRLSGLGIASFGPLDIDPASSSNGRFLSTPKPGWQGASYRDALRDLGAPIAIDTDVNGAALGEWLHGAGRGCRTLAYTTIGTGIGAGVLQDGKSLLGFSHLEAGHILPRRHEDDATFAGVCPFHGDCLEGLAAGPAIAQRWGANLSEDPRPEKIALIAYYAAQLAAILVLTHMPDRLIFGGGVAKTPGFVETLRGATRRILAGYVTELDRDLSDYIVRPDLGDDAGLAGAFALARRARDNR